MTQHGTDLIVGGSFTTAGATTVNDVARWEPCSGPCPADFDGNGTVDFGDVVTMLAAWGPCGGCPEDLNGNGSVDFGDVVILLAAWGPC